MSRLRIGVWIVGLCAAAAFAHFFLPSHDVVRIVGTEIARVGVTGENAQGEEITRTRDVRYIKAATPDGAPRVYRNEDTGWGWPPYFKFDSASMAAQADAVISTAEAPRWVVVTHYGWRLPIFSEFPNAVSITPADGPDDAPFPWLNVAIVVAAALGFGVLRRAALIALGGR
jgi:hypothetical protein